MSQVIRRQIVIIFLCTFALFSTNALSSSRKNFHSSDLEESHFFKRSKSDHSISVFHLGMESLTARLKLIESARNHIYLEYFIFDADPSTRLLLQALVKKAKEGVEVKILLDHFMTKPQIDKFLVEELRKSGVEVKFYNPARKIRFVKMQYRNHRKLFLVDNWAAMIGGRNIADEYFDLKSDYNFIDLDILIEGQIVNNMRETFLSFWNHKISKKIKRPKKPRYRSFRYRQHSYELFESMLENDPTDRFLSLGRRRFLNDLKTFDQRVRDAKSFISENEKDRDLKKYIIKQTEQSLHDKEVYRCDNVVFVSDMPGWGRKSRKTKYMAEYVDKVLNGVKKNLVIDSPYFIPDKKNKKAIRKLLKQKKSVKVLTNGLFSTDAIYVNTVFDSELKGWLKRGLNPYLFKGYPLQSFEHLKDKQTRWGTHSKTFIADDNVLVGTYNLDPRSSRYNTEFGLSCIGNLNLLSRMNDIFAEKVSFSHHIKSKKEYKKVRFFGIEKSKKVIFYLIYPLSILFRPLL